MNVVELHQISKHYGNFYALSQVSLKIPKGSIYGLIGQNGAGKSTMMKLICGQIKQSEGAIELFGKEPKQDPYCYRRIGSMIETAGFYPSLNAYDNMKVKALSLGCYEEGQLRSLLEGCGIANTGKKKVRHFSLGMKQRLGIAMALLGNPELLILDEPTNGLDPQGIREIRSLLLKLNQEKAITILISSHILEELSKIANHYAIIKEGRILEQLTREELDEKCGDFLCLRCDQPAKAVALLEEHLQLSAYEVVEEDQIHIFTPLQASAIAEVLITHQIKLHEIYTHKMNLEDYFLQKSGD